MVAQRICENYTKRGEMTEFEVGDIAVEHELERLVKIIKDLKKMGRNDTEILDQIERDLNVTIEECKTGWR